MFYAYMNHEDGTDTLSARSPAGLASMVRAYFKGWASAGYPEMADRKSWERTQNKSLKTTWFTCAG